MLFSSLTFLYLFLPATGLLYLAAPPRWRNAVLLAVSLWFYYWGEPVYTLLLFGSSLSDYAHSLYIERHRGTRWATAALVSSIVLNLGLLAVFKYADFLLSIWNSLTGQQVPLPHLALPVGISFFTFQTMSYTIDVYRGDVHAERNLATLATYVCLFPQLVAGPIVRYADVAAQLHQRELTVENAAAGLRRFVVGLGKKVLIANVLGELAAGYRAAAAPSVGYAWLYALGFTLQIYFDFSAYSDMAIGLGRVFGFTFPENFNYPYLACSITEFWRRWHMSLSTWFRDYVYIPLGGNRRGRARQIRNLLVVWALTGLWHGAAWNFVLWGALFGLVLIGEKFLWGKALSRLPRAAGWVYTMVLVVVSFVIFNADSLSGAAADLHHLAGGLPLSSAETVYQLRSYGGVLLAALLGATPLPARAGRWLQAQLPLLEPVLLAVLLLVSTAFLVDGSFNPFLYFRF